MGTGDCSKSGVAPNTGYTRAAYRMSARAKGAGWGIIDISTLSAIQMLYLVEFANNNSQQMIGRGYCDGNSAAIKTGSCDTVPKLTGRPAGTDGKTDIVYRGIEGIWGNVWEWVDGVNFSLGKYYVSNNPSEYVDDTNANQTTLAYEGTSWSATYFSQIGLDSTYPYVVLPQGGGTGSETTYYCDAAWSTTSGWRVCKHGGLWGEGSKGGLFTTDFSADSVAVSSGIGSRLIYIP
jgi:hypothetical protein